MRALILIAVLFSTPAMAAEPVAQTLIPRGTVLTASHVTGPADGLVGLETTRAIRAGQAIEARSLRTPLAVRRNEMVTLTYKLGPMTIETSGRALDEGAVGARIRVINLDSRKRVSGRVRSQGIVEVG